MKKTLFVILTLALLLGSATSCRKKSEDPSLRKLRVVLDWTPNTNHTGLYVAQELGYFKDANLDVEIIQPGQNSAEQIVASGNALFGISYQESVIRAQVEGIPLVSLAAIIQHNTSGFASLKSAGITRPKDFAGKRYGSSGWPSELEILKSVVKADSASFEDVTVVEGVYDFFSTIGREADFEWIFWGWDGVEAQRRGIALDYIPVRDLNPVFDYYTPVLICNEKTTQADPKLVKDFMEAVAKGYQYCIQHPNEAADILIKAVPEMAANPEHIRLSMNYLKDQYQADALYWGYQRDEVWQGFVDWMFNKRLIMMGIKADKMFTNEFLPQ